MSNLPNGVSTTIDGTSSVSCRNASTKDKILTCFYFWEYESGNRDVIGILTAEESNFLYARRLAKTYGWWNFVTSTMQSLRSLYGHTGHRAEWTSLVEDIVPDFVNTTTDKLLFGKNNSGV